MDNAYYIIYSFCGFICISSICISGIYLYSRSNNNIELNNSNNLKIIIPSRIRFNSVDIEEQTIYPDLTELSDLTDMSNNSKKKEERPPEHV